jgi:8-amino-3,8-dideoxy-alpha-D-manno-octulosonate transaminase
VIVREEMTMSTNKRPELNRRAFLAAVPAICAVPLVASGEEKLAVDGGTPVRTAPLHTECPGTQFYDDKERTELGEAYDTHSLFRFYGPVMPVKVAKFEQDLAAFMGTKYALAVTSGTAALHVALTALGAGPGDEVILPAWTWHSCYTAILMTGALPVFAETDESFTLDPRDVEKKITPQTKIVMAVHLFGAPADMGKIMPLARRHGLKVLEDSAQSAGGQYQGKRLGSIGDMGIYSFQVHKFITAGEGGAVVTNDPLLYERAIRFHDLGLLRPIFKDRLGEPLLPFFPGVNYRMNEMTGAVMRAQLRKLDTIVARHRNNHRFVMDRIQDLPGIHLRPSRDPEGDLGWTIAVLLPDRKTRNRFVAAMNAENVEMSAPSGSIPLPREPYIANKAAPHPAWPSFNSPRGREIQYGAQCCPQTIAIFDRAAQLTIGPKYTESDLKDIVAAITKVYRAV